MGEFVLSQEALKYEVWKLKDKIGKILIALQYLVEERENEEPLVTSVWHHNTIPQPQDINCPSFYHPQGEMVPQIMYQINCV